MDVDADADADADADRYLASETMADGAEDCDASYGVDEYGYEQGDGCPTFGSRTHGGLGNIEPLLFEVGARPRNLLWNRILYSRRSIRICNQQERACWMCLLFTSRYAQYKSDMHFYLY